MAPGTSPTPKNGTADQPPAKRKRLTAAEKAAKAEEEAKKKKEREDLRQQKLAEKAKQDMEKQIAKAARQAEKAKKDAEEQEAKAAKQQEREEKRKKKEEEERKAREEKEKKERSQLRLQSFFKAPATPKKPAAATLGAVDAKAGTDGGTTASTTTTPRKKPQSEYERMFQPFFVKEHVRMAPTSLPIADQETLEAKSKILDEYVNGHRGIDVTVKPFNPIDTFHLIQRPNRTGKTHPPVRALIEELHDNSNAGALAKLRSIPMKLLCFRQDVRPPYYGTITCLPHQFGPARLRRAARRPTQRVLDLEYDYDSEAEWQDDEPGDDLDDLDEEEEDLEDEDDMDGFLDDSEDAGVARRIFANTMEPESTGLCFENAQGVGPVASMRAHRMEIILGMLSRAHERCRTLH